MNDPLLEQVWLDILNNPEDEYFRLIFADLLEEREKNQDEINRAKFIRLQIWKKNINEQTKLVMKWDHIWSNGLFKNNNISYRYINGFVGTLSIDLNYDYDNHWLTHLDCNPIIGLTLTGRSIINENIIINHPRWNNIRELCISMLSNYDSQLLEGKRQIGIYVSCSVKGLKYILKGLKRKGLIGVSIILSMNKINRKIKYREMVEKLGLEWLGEDWIPMNNYNIQGKQ